MITVEQLKNLKPGDPLIVHGKFKYIYNDGDIVIEVATTGGYGDGAEIIKDTKYVHPSCVSLPSVKPIEMCHTAKIPKEYPKYDSCRRFKEGDIVKPKENVYLEPFAEEPLDIRDRYVVESVLATGWLHVSAKNEQEPFEIWGGMLELVTPVEDLKPYSVTYDDKFYHIHKHGEAASIAVYSEARHPHAKAAAEAERDRLNAEWIKTSNLN